MPRKCVNSSDALCYICGEVILKNPEDGLSHHRLRNAMSIISAAKWVIRTILGSPFLLRDIRQASRGMGKMFTLYAFPHSYGLERAHGPCFRLLLLPDQYHWCNSKVQTHCSISKFIICDEASTSQCGVTCAKASNKHDAE